MKKDSRIYIAGHSGLVGSALNRKLETEGFSHIIKKTHAELDLTRQSDVDIFFKSQKPEYVFLAAAKVGGILANNNYPAEFIHDNLVIQNNVIHAAWEYGVKRMIFLGSSCIYPKHCPQPMQERHLLTGALEPTNKPYAIAKISGIIQCEAYNRQYGTKFLGVMPTNLYGPNDNFNLSTSHVLPALIRKFHEAKIEKKKTVTIWGTGKPRREFLYVDDLADACFFLMNSNEKNFDSLLHTGSAPIINVGCGQDISIGQLASLVKEVTGFKGTIVYDDSKPDGTPRKLLEISKMASLNWRAKISLEQGIRTTYEWWLQKSGCHLNTAN